jgi:anthranilate phosphoribosyltransferase
MAPKMLAVMRNTGVLRALVVQGDGGLDELSISGPSRVLELSEGEVRPRTIDPLQLGITPAPLEAIRGGTPAVNAAIVRRTLDGEAGAVREIVTLNAAAGLLVGEAVASLAEGVELARAVLDDGRAASVLERLVATTNAASDTPDGGPRSAADGVGS